MSEGVIEILIPTRNNTRNKNFFMFQDKCEDVTESYQRSCGDFSVTELVLVDSELEGNSSRTEYKLFGENATKTLQNLNLPRGRKYVCVPFDASRSRRRRSGKIKCSKCNEDLDQSDFESSVRVDPKVCEFCKYLSSTRETGVTRKIFNSIRKYVTENNKSVKSEPTLSTGSTRSGVRENEEIEMKFEDGKRKYQNGKFQESLRLLQECLNHTLAKYNHSQVEVGQKYLWVGQCLSRLFKYDKSNEFYRKSLSIMETVFKKTHPSVIKLHSKIGWNYMKLKRLEQAKEEFELGFALAKRLPNTPSNNALIAKFHNDFGGYYERIHEYDKALDHFKKRLRICEQWNPRNLVVEALALFNVGIQYKKKKVNSTAIGYFNKSLQIREKILTRDHPDIGKTCNNLGHCYYSLKNSELSLLYFNRALAIYEKCFKRDNNSMVKGCYFSIGLVHEFLKSEFQKALDMYLKSGRDGAIQRVRRKLL